MDKTTLKVLMLVNIVTFVFFIILVVNFFKLAKNVKRIKEGQNLFLLAKIEFLNGDKEKAKEVLDKAFFTDLVLAKEDESYNTEFEKNITKYKAAYESMGLTPIDLGKYKNVNSIP